MRAPVYINGKFTAQRTTGVQRVARQIVLALDRLELSGRWVLLLPPGAEPPPLRRISVREVPGPRRLHAWEQWSLPHAARDGLLLGLSGSAPWFARRQSLLIHDAAVFDHPEAYAPAFSAWYRRLFRRLARRAERLFTVSAFSRDRLAAALGVPPARFHVLPNGADHLDAVTPDPLALSRLGVGDGPFLLNVGSANPTKNLHRLVQAFAARPSQPLRLVLAGGRNERVFAGERTTPDPPGVVRTGPVADGELVALYRAATALVFPSTYEGFGLPPLEAMRFGCPVAASHSASIPEVCGDAALYFDALDVRDIASAMDQMVGDMRLRNRLREAGLARAAGFSWRRSAETLLQLVESAP